jgi:hypothetical protein
MKARASQVGDAQLQLGSHDRATLAVNIELDAAIDLHGIAHCILPGALSAPFWRELKKPKRKTTGGRAGRPTPANGYGSALAR